MVVHLSVRAGLAWIASELPGQSSRVRSDRGLCAPGRSVSSRVYGDHSPTLRARTQVPGLGGRRPPRPPPKGGQGDLGDPETGSRSVGAEGAASKRPGQGRRLSARRVRRAERVPGQKRPFDPEEAHRELYRNPGRACCERPALRTGPSATKWKPRSVSRRPTIRIGIADPPRGQSVGGWPHRRDG